MESEEYPIAIVKVAGLLLIGIILISAVYNTSDFGNRRAASISFTTQPQDGETIIIDGNTFEFDIGNGVTSLNIPVIIASTSTGTANNLKAAILNANYEAS